MTNVEPFRIKYGLLLPQLKQAIGISWETGVSPETFALEQNESKTYSILESRAQERWRKGTCGNSGCREIHVPDGFDYLKTK
jgi:hypothetical protein